MAGKLISVFACGVILLGLGLIGLRFSGFVLTSLHGESMEPNLSAGSFVVSRAADPQDIRIGDVVVFPNWDKEQLDPVVHRVVQLNNEKQGRVAVTMGDNNLVVDPKKTVLGDGTTRAFLTILHLGRWAIPTLGWWMLIVGVLFILANIASRVWPFRKAGA